MDATHRPVVETLDVVYPPAVIPSDPGREAPTIGWCARVVMGLTHVDLAGIAEVRVREGRPEWAPIDDQLTTSAREGRAGFSRPVSPERERALIGALLDSDALRLALNEAASDVGLTPTTDKGLWQAVLRARDC